MLPIQMCFFDYDETFFDPIDYVTLVIFWIDIILNCRTTYMNSNNEEVVDGKLLFWKYIKSSHFLIDVFSALPLKFFVTEMVQNIQLLKAFKVVKILRLLRAKRFQSYFADDKFRIIYKLLCLLIVCIIIVPPSPLPPPPKSHPYHP